MPPKNLKGSLRALGGPTLTGAIGPQDIKLLGKLTYDHDPVGVIQGWDLLGHRAHQLPARVARAAALQFQLVFDSVEY